MYHVFGLEHHGEEVQAEAGDDDPEHADEGHEAPHVLQLHADHGQSRDDIQRLEQVGAFVAQDEGVQAGGQVGALDVLHGLDDQGGPAR